MRKHKSQIERLASELQKSQSIEAEKAKQLVDLMFEDAKDKLVSSSGDDTLRLQGEAKAFERLYTLLTRLPLQQQGG